MAGAGLSFWPRRLTRLVMVPLVTGAACLEANEFVRRSRSSCDEVDAKLAASDDRIEE